MTPRVTLIVAALALCSCATQQKTAELAPKRGPAPTEAQAERFILGVLAQGLKDPDSLKQFRMRNGPTPISWYQGLLAGGQYDSGWLFCFEYNAKNSYGAYTGVKIEGVALRIGTNGEYPYSVPVNWGMADTHC